MTLQNETCDELPPKLKFEVEEPQFEWALRPGKIILIEEHDGDFLFGLNHPSNEQYLAFLEFSKGRPPEHFKFFNGYVIQFTCGLSDDLKSKRKDTKDMRDITFFTNVRTTLGVEFKLRFAEWF